MPGYLGDDHWYSLSGYAFFEADTNHRFGKPKEQPNDAAGPDSAPSGPGLPEKEQGPPDWRPRLKLAVSLCALRLCGGRCLRGGRGLCRRSRGGLHRIGLVIEADNLLGDVNGVGGINDGRILRRRIEHGDIAVLAGVAVEHVHHLASNAIDNVALGGVYVFLHFVLLAIELLRQALALSLRASLLLIAPGVRIRGNLLTQIVDLLVEGFQLVLPRSELRLQFRRSLLALRGGDDGLPHVEDRDLVATRRGRRILRTNRRGPRQTQGGRQGHTNNVSRVHCFLLISFWHCLVPGGRRLGFGKPSELNRYPVKSYSTIPWSIPRRRIAWLKFSNDRRDECRRFPCRHTKRTVYPTPQQPCKRRFLQFPLPIA